jgi:hypothetical protein
MTKKTSLFLLIILIINGLIFAQKGNNYIPGLTGSGVETDKILISSAKDMDTLSYFVRQSQKNTCKGKYFRVTKDIVFDTTKNFIPIGGRNYGNEPDSNFVFSGIFDGDYHLFTKLTIIDTTKDFTGMFGFIKDADVSKIKIAEATVKGKNYCGILCGFCASGSLLRTSSVRSSLVDGNIYVAAILGYLQQNATLRGTKYTGCNIFGLQNVGDICGYNENTNEMADKELNVLEEKGYKVK